VVGKRKRRKGKRGEEDPEWVGWGNGKEERNMRAAMLLRCEKVGQAEIGKGIHKQNKTGWGSKIKIWRKGWAKTGVQCKASLNKGGSKKGGGEERKATKPELKERGGRGKRGGKGKSA